MTEGRFEDRYRTGDTPWDHGTVDHNLLDMLAQYAVRPCRTLDVGCGTGENAIWLGQQGFDVVACDLSPTAIQEAEKKRKLRGGNVRFIVADFIADAVPEGPYGLIFDRGCLHCMDTESERTAFIQKVAALLDQEGYWLSLIGNADEGEREVGPPQLTAAEVVSAIEPYFQIQSLTSGFFGSDQDDPPRAWICMLQKRQL